jgi:ABC-type nickel/cobalt efflux system permease component RcnA
MWQAIVELQREVYFALADHLSAFAEGGGWGAFAAFLPMAVVFGALHALTPGHSKAVLATYLMGSAAPVARGLLVSMALSFTHVGMAVLIALLSLPLVETAFGSTGRAPLLEDVSRALLGLIGLWMLARAIRGPRAAHGTAEGTGVGVMAGLVPCPLTLFVMTFAIGRGVPEAGVAFAGAMILGVGATLALVAVVATVFRDRTARLLRSRPRLLAKLSRSTEALAGVVLLAIAAREVLLR